MNQRSKKSRNLSGGLFWGVQKNTKKLRISGLKHFEIIRYGVKCPICYFELYELKKLADSCFELLELKIIELPLVSKFIKIYRAESIQIFKKFKLNGTLSK